MQDIRPGSPGVRPDGENLRAHGYAAQEPRGSVSPVEATHRERQADSGSSKHCQGRAEEIRRLRNSPETTGIIIEMRSLLDLMKSENAPRHGSLMEKAVRYLDHFWNQVFLSIVSTCKLQRYSILEYLKKFFAEITAGNRDYGKLMPSTIGISANNL